jgi:phage-related protein
LFGIVGEGSGSFLKFTGSIGDFLVSVDQALKKGDRLHNFFVLLGSILAAPIRLLKQLASAIGELFGGFDQKASGGVSDSLDAMGRSMTPLQKLIQAISEAWRRFINSFGNAGQVIQPVVDGIVKVFQGITPALNSAIQSMNFSAILEVIRTGLLGGLVLMFKKFFAGGSFADALGGFGGGILGNISGAFDALTGSLKAMQTNIKADTLRKIAIAIALLTASVVALSFIDDKKLNKALAAMAIGFGQLLASMAILTKISGTAGFVKVPVIAASMILLAGAITLLTLAVRSLSSLSWGELIKGLTGVSVLLVVISQAAGPLSRNSAGMISAGLGITAIAVAMKILASAIGDFGGLSWGEIGKGLAGVAVGLALIAAASKLMPPGMVAIGAGLVAVALGLKILGSAVAQFGDMDWKVIGKGMVGIAGGLLIIAAAMNLMPKNMVVTAAGLLLVAIALKGVVSSIESFGGMSVGGLAKGLISLALALTILTVALYAMEGTLAGAAALAIAAAGLALLAPALVALGKQSWGQIVKGLVSLTAALVILGAAGILLEPVIPAMLGLGAALVLVGAGLALAGAGIALIGVGLSAIAVAGPVAVGILVQALVQLAESIPRVITKLVIGLLQVVQALAASAPKFVAAMAQILILLLDAIIKAAPKIAQAFTALLDMALSVIKSNQGKIIQAGFDLIIAFLKGINNNIPRVVSMFITIILTIINTVVGQLGRIVNAGAQLLAKFLIGIANNIATVVRSAVNVVLSFASGIAQTLGKITAQGLSIVTHLVSAVASGAAKLVSSGIKMVSNIITGIFDKLGDLASAGAKAAARFISSVAHAALELVDKGAQAIINFMNGVASAIRRYEPQMIRAGTNIGAAIISGLVSGITSSGGRIVSALGGVVGNAINAAKKKLHIKSPSRVFYEIGTNIIDGLALGITENEDTTTTAVESMVSNIADLANTIPSYLDGIIDMEPVITPVLDLTAVQAGADQMTGIIATTPVVAATSFGQASAISTAPPPGTEEAAQVPGTSVTFQQNNYSPEALSEVEIYRQTKNQISQLRTALALP